MRRHATNRPCRPVLEVLEGRELPSGLLGTLQGLQGDLNTANSNFNRDFAALQGSQSVTSTTTPAGLLTQYSNATADWQRMLSDQLAIQQTGAADINFLNFAAFASGNADIFFATLFFVDPAFQNVINQANTTVGNAQPNANTPFNFTTNPLLAASFPGTTPSIASNTAP